MHRVIKNHLYDFKSDHAVSYADDKAFECFCGYILSKKFTFDAADPKQFTYEGADPGIDSCIFVINDSLISTLDEIKNVFDKKKNNNEVRLILIQSKTSEAWSKAEANTFESGSLDFISDDPKQPLSEHLREKKAMLDIVFSNVGKIKNGRPSFLAYYVTTAQKTEAVEILAALGIFKKRVQDTGFFDDVDVEQIGRDEIIKLWNSSKGSYSATFKVIGSAPFPKSTGIEESYICTLNAKEFVNKVLKDESGGLRKGIFEENVRDFIDFEDSGINAEILGSLEDSERRNRFGIMNNGITLISPDLRVQSNEIYISNYQIVNGCQTSNVLFAGQAALDENATLMVKVVETSDQEIVDDIVRSTNRQNKVEEHQFLATLESVKAVEQYFLARGGEEQHKLYFERRPNQFQNEAIPSIRVFDLKETARCVGAMFFDKPDLASRYPNVLVDDLQSLVFDKNNKEEIFYAATYALYRIKLHQSNTRIDPVFSKMRWHTLMAVRYFIVDNPSNAKSHKIDKECKQIMDFVSRNDEQTMKQWEDMAARLHSLGPVDRDRLRTTKFVAEIRDAMKQREIPF